MTENDLKQLQQAGSALEVQQAAVIKRLEARIDALRAERDDALNALSRIVDQAFDTEYSAYTWEDFDSLRWIARCALSGITRRIAEALKAGKP